MKCFYDEISSLQEQILDLLVVSKDNYACSQKTENAAKLYFLLTECRVNY